MCSSDLTPSARSTWTAWRETAASRAASVAGVLLLVVVCISVASTLWYSATERRYEFAVRAALGASRATLFWSMLSQGLWTAAVAVVIGLPAAFAATRWLGSRMTNIESPSGLALAVPVVVVMAAAALAGTMPAIRAAKTAPASVLAEE